MKKRGLSQVVTTVLIILLVLAAVVIIWAVIRPTIEDAGGKIAGGSECLTLDLEVVSCTANPGGVDVTVSRGAGAADLDQIRLVIDGQAFDQAVVPDELETETYTVSAGVVGSEADVGGILASGGACEPLNEAVVCS